MRVMLKLDVDTHEGLRDGGPNLLDLFGEFGIKASAFFTFGPDNSGQVIRRIFTKKGFLRKMLRTRATSVYSKRTMLYGTLLKAPPVAEAFPEILRGYEAAGHEVGIHGYDHVNWHDKLDRMGRDKIRDIFGKASASYEEILGHSAETCAAPGWKVNADSLHVQDEAGIICASDTRGETPFRPVIGGVKFRALQVPTTLPTLDEILGERCATAAEANEIYLGLMKKDRLNVMTIHTEFEGKPFLEPFRDLLVRLKDAGAEFVRMKDVCAEIEGNRAETPECEVVNRELPGRAGAVGCQGSV